MRAVAGRLGYCSLDRTRAVLQGDEVRACWQAPASPVPFEGLFRDLEPDDPAPGRPGVTFAPDAPAEEVPARTRTWAVPVTVARPVPIPAARPAVSDAGLREATHVPARSISRTTRDDSALLAGDLQVLGVAQGPTVREGDHDAQEARPDDGLLHDPDV